MTRFTLTAVVEVQAPTLQAARDYLVGVLEVGDDVAGDPDSRISSWEVHDEDLTSPD